MEPEQIGLRACLHVVESRSQRFGLLRNSVAASRTAVKSETDGVGAMVIHRRPVFASDVVLWLRSVMESFLHDVMKTQRRHGGETGLPRTHHHPFHGPSRFVVRRQ